MESRQKTGGHVCAARYCTNKQYKSKASFFRFPKDSERAKRWAMAAGREDLLEKSNLYGSYRLCGAHFEPKMMLNNLRNRLTETAMPTIFPRMEGSSTMEHNYSIFQGEMMADPVPSTSSQEPSIGMQHDVSNAETVKMLCTSNVSGELSETDETSFDRRSSVREIFIDTSYTEDLTSPISSPTSTQTPQLLTAHTPRKDKLRKVVKSLRNKVKILEKRNSQLTTSLENARKEALEQVTLEQYQTLTHKFCPNEKLATFINVQVSQSRKSAKGRRFTLTFKRECLEIYFSGAKLYQKVLMGLFTLPSPTTLLKLLKNLRINVGLNNSELFSMMEMKVQNFKDLDKVCVLSLDEMAIKAQLFYSIGLDKVCGLEDSGHGDRIFKPAKNATTLMLRGIFTNWKQPLCYYFFHSTCPGRVLLEIVQEVLSILTRIGLKVRLVVNDMGSNNIQMCNLLNISPERPYFQFENQKIVYMFDAPHLLKALRNNFKKYKFLHDGKEILFRHVEHFYKMDKLKPFRGAPKLTDSHIYPNNFEKMKVKYASQLFSESVATGLNMYLSSNAGLSTSAMYTAEFIATIDKLFDVLNSSTFHAKKLYNKPFQGLEHQIEFLKECFLLFKNLKVVDWTDADKTSCIKCLKGFRITINALLNLWELLRDEFNINFILTRRLSQDCLENLFGTIRRKNGNCHNPTAIQFQQTFRNVLCVKLFHSGTENCEGDQDTLLLKLGEMHKDPEAIVMSSNTSEAPTKSSIEVLPTDYRKNEMLEQNLMRYICGYIIGKCLGTHSCPVCVEYANNHQDLDDTSFFCFLKAYENGNMDTFGNLKMPADTFVYFIAMLETIFQDNFKALVVRDNVVANLVLLFSAIKFSHPCENFPYTYCMKLYARIRLFYTLKFINRNFKSIGNKEKLIVWKHQ